MYPLEMTSILSGATVHQLRHWRTSGLLVPSVQDKRPPIWSFQDIVALRTVVRLRNATSLQRVRKAFRNLDALDLAEHPSKYRFEAIGGSIAVRTPSGQVIDLVTSPGTEVLANFADVFASFERDGRVIADLRRPRPHLQVTPGKLHGWPTIENTRIAYDTIASLADEVPAEDVLHFYPSVTEAQVDDAVSLHREAVALRDAA